MWCKWWQNFNISCHFFEEKMSILGGGVLASDILVVTLAESLADTRWNSLSGASLSRTSTGTPQQFVGTTQPCKTKISHFGTLLFPPKRDGQGGYLPNLRGTLFFCKVTHRMCYSGNHVPDEITQRIFVAAWSWAFPRSLHKQRFGGFTLGE